MLFLVYVCSVARLHFIPAIALFDFDESHLHRLHATVNYLRTSLIYCIRGVNDFIQELVSREAVDAFSIISSQALKLSQQPMRAALKSLLMIQSEWLNARSYRTP